VRRTLAFAFLVLAAPTAASAHVDSSASVAAARQPTSLFVVSGHGWGHGVGLAQYGAYGYAKHGLGYRSILAHYYPGTTIGSAPVRRVRVLLAQGKAELTLSSKADFTVTDATGKTHDVAAGKITFDSKLKLKVDDVAKAKALLKSAGVGALKLTLLSQNDTATLAQAQAIQQGLQRVGVSVTLKPEDENSYYSDLTATHPKFDLSLTSWQPDFPSANSNISPLFESSQIGGGNYDISQYSNKSVDAAIAAAQAEVDQTKAQAQWAAIDKRIMQDAPVVPLIYAKQSFLHGSGVGNFFIPSFPAYPDYMTVTLTK
jgi:hypothetical protein